MSKQILKVDGMSCNHCVMAVKNSIKQVDGVSFVEVDLKTGTVTVDLGKDVPRQHLEQAVKDAGYIVVEE